MRKIEKLEEAISESYAAWSEEVEYAGDWWEHTHYSGRLVALDDVRAVSYTHLTLPTTPYV